MSGQLQRKPVRTGRWSPGRGRGGVGGGRVHHHPDASATVHVEPSLASDAGQDRTQRLRQRQSPHEAHVPAGHDARPHPLGPVRRGYGRPVAEPLRRECSLPLHFFFHSFIVLMALVGQFFFFSTFRFLQVKFIKILVFDVQISGFKVKYLVLGSKFVKIVVFQDRQFSFICQNIDFLRSKFVEILGFITLNLLTH